MSAALAELCAAIGMVQDISPAQVPQQTTVDAALAQVQALHDDVAEIRQSLAAKKLVPLPGDRIEKCTAELGATSKLIGSSMAQLLTAAAQVPHFFVVVLNFSLVRYQHTITYFVFTLLCDVI